MREESAAAGYNTGVVIDVRLRPADPLRIEVPALADRLAQIRRGLTAWLESIGVPDDVIADVVLAVNEAATNCVEHAYLNSEQGVMMVEASVEGDRLVVCVVDHGAWRTPTTEPTTRGRGILIMRAVGDDVDVDNSTSGTKVTMIFDVTEDRPQELGNRTT
ncbi:Anti-sigma regulatory factor (Ser/Thr protein kinase) [Mycolicibacterium rutilum]|uniref:Anti-sigma regulatory factor (Ser/Thr protein kinase) n=1 Tax=Mycolicibacterium rutilum TaxID=370526 RepID=A0A1H6JJ69_MYCRU|nr:ATP-binding protein [Mycolicibacterium rutilum]SEH59207.1 Anti-sigma regulatory factor (Ser/Thr protein kinase) [Mycolicibacterium rutilum]